MSEDINVVALVKGEHRYIFIYSDANKTECLRVFGRFASNPELLFSWYDAAVLSQRVRGESGAQPADSVSEAVREMFQPKIKESSDAKDRTVKFAQPLADRMRYTGIDPQAAD